MFVHIGSSSCLAICGISSSVPVWARTGKRRRDRGGGGAGGRARSAPRAQGRPWEGAQVAEAAGWEEMSHSGPLGR